MFLTALTITPSGTYRIVIVGAGNVATHLARHLFSRGHSIVTIYSRTLKHAEELATLVAAVPTDSLEEVPLQADVYLVALPDGEVGRISAQLNDRRGIWVHTAGALPLNIFEPFHDEFGVLYPLQTLSRDRQISLQEVPLLIEGSSPEVARVLKTLASSISGDVHEVDSRARHLIHLAAVFANNFSNHMVEIARRILEEEGENYHLLLPLLQETCRKLEEMEPASAQTGPAVRGDRETMKKHLELLGGHPEWQKLYTFISRDITRSRKD